MDMTDDKFSILNSRAYIDFFNQSMLRATREKLNNWRLFRSICTVDISAAYTDAGEDILWYFLMAED